jgi:activator of HSP90 ATPase
MRKPKTQSCIFIAALGLNALPIVSAQPVQSNIIHQEIEVNATPQQLYKALLDSKQFTEFSGRTAEINREVGGAFSLFKGHIMTGAIPRTVTNERIVRELLRA